MYLGNPDWTRVHVDVDFVAGALTRKYEADGSVCTQQAYASKWLVPGQSRSFHTMYHVVLDVSDIMLPVAPVRWPWRAAAPDSALCTCRVC